MLKKLKELAQRVLAIGWIRKIHLFTMRLVLETFGSHRLLSVPYSLLAFLVFNREQFAVLRGRRNYYRNLSRVRRSQAELRRNIHRLEKGISMRPRRDVFALDYLMETITSYEAAVGSLGDEISGIDHEELTWAHNVLTEYFSIVDGSHPKVAEAARRFSLTQANFRPHDRIRKPFTRSESLTDTVRYEDLLKLAMQRRSVRWFRQVPVPRDLIDKALLIARQSPSACNRLPYEFRIFDDPALVRKIADIPFGTAGYAHQIPVIAVLVGRLDHYFSARDRHAIYIDSALAAMSFMLALETLGLSSSVINWPDFELLEARMQKALGLGWDERVVMLIAVGFADPHGLIPYSEKKSLDVLRSYNRSGV